MLHGIGNAAAFAESEHIPVVDVSEGAFQRMEGNMSGEFLSFYAYSDDNKSRINYMFDNGTGYGIGLYDTACLSQYSYLGEPENYHRCYVPESQGDNRKAQLLHREGIRRPGRPRHRLHLRDNCGQR